MLSIRHAHQYTPFLYTQLANGRQARNPFGRGEGHFLRFLVGLRTQDV